MSKIVIEFRKLLHAKRDHFRGVVDVTACVFLRFVVGWVIYDKSTHIARSSAGERFGKLLQNTGSTKLDFEIFLRDTFHWLLRSADVHLSFQVDCHNIALLSRPVFDWHKFRLTLPQTVNSAIDI